MLFGDRLKENQLTVSIESQPLWSSNSVIKAVDFLADEMGLITYNNQDII